MGTDWNNTFRDANWRPASVDEIRYQWAEDVACINCFCGAEIILSETLAHTCRCGRTYRYLCRVEIVDTPTRHSGEEDR